MATKTTKKKRTKLKKTAAKRTPMKHTAKKQTAKKKPVQKKKAAPKKKLANKKPAVRKKTAVKTKAIGCSRLQEATPGQKSERECRILCQRRSESKGSGTVGKFAGIVRRRGCRFGERGRVARGRKRVRS